MARGSKTYIVLERIHGETKRFRSFTLRDWCDKNGVAYNTILARIWRDEGLQNPELEGVVYFEANDPILSTYGISKKKEFVPPHRKNPRRKNILNGEPSSESRMHG